MSRMGKASDQGSSYFIQMDPLTWPLFFSSHFLGILKLKIKMSKYRKEKQRVLNEI